MALKRSLAIAGELLEESASKFHKHREFISNPDWIQTAKEGVMITGLTYLTKFLNNPNSVVKAMEFGFFGFARLR